MDTVVSWHRVSQAVSWYTSLGYKYTEVPWVIDDAPYNVTRPPGAPAYATLGGNLVASGEQSFMQLMDNGIRVGKSVCCTPCFRAEPEYDELHLPYFMKVELIHKSGGKEDLHGMIGDAHNFFENCCNIRCDVVIMPDDSYDIVDGRTGIELGSYGIRRWKDFSWVYGTGVAEPRTSQVVRKQKSENKLHPRT
jgi:hypothetical protein